MILSKLIARVLTIVALASAAPVLADSEGGKGGPYEAAGVVAMSAQTATSQDNGGFRSLFQSWKRLDGPGSAVSIPSQRPLDITTSSSGYGVRSDPFRHTAAFHAGVDMPGPLGTAVYATADGIVGRAGWASGYGNLIELQHGEGIATRYGHLSAIVVQPGQRVQRGQLIGRMGSTGRSTGSHLHYEVRLEGHAVNPVPFLQSANYLTLMDAQKEKPTTLKEDMGD
jgi:murein DD-endopeptidase MepM/ murein hydrolase activator NlpD